MARDKIMIGGLEFDNASRDRKVGFIEDGHKYVLIEDPTFKWTSVTSVASPYKEGFDAEKHARRVCSTKSNKTYYGRHWEDVVKQWRLLGEKASAEGTELHSFGEDCLINPDDMHTFNGPDNPKTPHVIEAVKDLYSRGYELAETEILLYDTKIAVAGQSDILLRKEKKVEQRHFSDPPTYEYMIYDWKFLNKPLQMKSFQNKYTKKYKMMTGPFAHLYDCNWIHYSIQLAIYQTLTGEPHRIREKVLVVVTDDKYEFVPAYPMRIYWDKDYDLQAVYETPYGKWYVSEYNRMFDEQPDWIEGF